MHYDGSITSALLEKRFDDARKLKLQKAQPEFVTSEVISDELRSRLENLLALLISRFKELAAAGGIDDCELCNRYVDMIEKILNRKT